MRYVSRTAPCEAVGTIPDTDAFALRATYEGGATDDQIDAARSINRAAHQNEAWIACDCCDAQPVMAPVRLGTTYYLRRLPQHGDHAANCVFKFDASDRVQPDEQVVPARVRFSSGGFIRILDRRGLTSTAPTIGADRHVKTSAASRLAQCLWTLIDTSGLNISPPVQQDEGHHDLSSELGRLRAAAKDFMISSNVSLLDVLTTYGSDYFGRSRWHARVRGAWSRLEEEVQPQAFILTYARSVRAKSVHLADGVITCSGRVTWPIHSDASSCGPYLVLVVASDLQDGRGIQAIRAYAQPVHSHGQLIPVESGGERKILDLLLKFRAMAAQRFPALRITVTKPVFDVDMDGKLLRPDFVLLIVSPAVPAGETVFVSLLGFGSTAHDAMRQPGIVRSMALVPTLIIEPHIVTMEPLQQIGWMLDQLYGSAGILAARRTCVS